MNTAELLTHYRIVEVAAAELCRANIAANQIDVEITTTEAIAAWKVAVIQGKRGVYDKGEFEYHLAAMTEDPFAYSDILDEFGWNHRP